MLVILLLAIIIRIIFITIKLSWGHVHDHVVYTVGDVVEGAVYQQRMVVVMTRVTTVLNIFIAMDTIQHRTTCKTPGCSSEKYC